MKNCRNGLFLKILTALTFIAMVIVNALANILPINGIGTGAVSDSYPNLFAPAGLTFAIWGLIYLLLAGYTLYQLGLFRDNKSTMKTVLLCKIGTAFSLSSLANAAWIFSWHYGNIPVSMLLMILILACLIYINQVINKETFFVREKLFVRIPFGVYFGWITIATIANATALLVDLKWNGFGLPEPTWTVIILAVGMLIGVLATAKSKSISYGLVLVWAYTGILIKHVGTEGFAGEYKQVIITVIVCIVLLAAALAYVAIQKIHKPAVK